MNFVILFQLYRWVWSDFAITSNPKMKSSLGLWPFTFALIGHLRKLSCFYKDHNGKTIMFLLTCFKASNIKPIFLQFLCEFYLV